MSGSGKQLSTDKKTLIQLMGREQDKNFIATVRSCRSTLSPYELLQEINEKQAQDAAYLEKSMETSCKHTFGAGHGAAGDKLDFEVSFKNLPRMANLLLCRIPYGLQPLSQSTRHTVLDSVYISEKVKEKGFEEEARKTIETVFATYNSFIGQGIELQDAMFILPLCIQKNLSIKFNVRGVNSFYVAATGGKSTKNYAKRSESFKQNPGASVPSAVIDVAEQLMSTMRSKFPEVFEDRGPNFEPLSFFPGTCDFFADKNALLEQIIESDVVKPIREGKTQAVVLDYNNPFKMTKQQIAEWTAERNTAFADCLPNITAKIVAQLDLAAVFDWKRQRSIRATYESLFHAAENFTYFIPQTIKDKNLEAEFKEAVDAELDLYKKMVAGGVPKEEAIGFLPHATRVYFLMTMDGWNILFHVLGLRLCTKTRPNLQAFSKSVADAIRQKDPVLGEFIAPRGTFYAGGCPEAQPCGRCEQILRNRTNRQA